YYALRVVPYSYSPIIESTSYIFIPVFGVFLLHEKISRRRLLGIGIMLIGILIFTL
nr:EamA family transporter [Lachnospiraceae bacterium]